MDGTITRPVHDFVAIRNQLGVPQGVGILEYIAEQPPSHRKNLSQQLTEIELEMAALAEPTPGIVELLAWLVDQGHRLGILTRNQRQCVDISLQRLGIHHLFVDSAIIACEDAAPKPDPDGVMKLIQRWSAKPDQCLILGDFLYDLQAGRDSGLMTVHYTADRADRWPEMTDIEVDDFDQLLQQLKAI